MDLQKLLLHSSLRYSANTLPLDPYTEKGLVFWKVLMHNYLFKKGKIMYIWKVQKA